MRVLEVAREAGVSVGILYYYFTDRAGLLAATFAHINERAGIYTREGPQPPTAVERARLLLLGELQDRPEVIENSSAWGELRASAIFEQALREPLASATTEWVVDIANLLALAQREGGVARDVDVVVAAEMLTALVEGLSNRWLSGSITLERALEILDGAFERECRLAETRIAETGSAA